LADWLNKNTRLTRWLPGHSTLESRLSKIFFFHPDRLWSPPSLLFCGYRGLDVKVTDHFHLVPRLRMGGPLPPLPHTLAACITNSKTHVEVTMSSETSVHFYQTTRRHMPKTSYCVRVYSCLDGYIRDSECPVCDAGQSLFDSGWRRLPARSICTKRSLYPRSHIYILHALSPSGYQTYERV